MSQNLNQGLTFKEIDNQEEHEILNARAITIYCKTDTCDISQYANVGGVMTLISTFALSEGQSFEAAADGSNLLSNIRVFPTNPESVALISVLAGTVNLVGG